MLGNVAAKIAREDQAVDAAEPAPHLRAPAQPRIQQSSTKRFDFFAKELAEAKTTELKYLDLIYRNLDALNIRVEKIDKTILPYAS